MKKQVKCRNCGKTNVAMPGGQMKGPGFFVQCDKCGTGLIIVFTKPYYYHQAFLIYAKEHLAEDETRVALVEAHSAFDVFVRSWAQAALLALQTPVAVREYILEQIRLSERLIDMVKILFPSCRFEKLPRKVITLRNQVIHSGKIPTKNEATSTIDAIEKWIEETLKKSETDFPIAPAG